MEQLMNCGAIFWHDHIWKCKAVAIWKVDSSRRTLGQFATIYEDEMSPILNLRGHSCGLAARVIFVLFLCHVHNIDHGFDFLREDFTAFLHFHYERCRNAIFIDVCHLVDLTVLTIIEEVIDAVLVTDNLSDYFIKQDVQVALLRRQLGQLVDVDIWCRFSLLYVVHVHIRKSVN